MTSKRALALSLILLILASCNQQGVRSFWKDHSIDYTDIQAAEDQFAQYAELAVAAPEKDALASLECLFKQLKKDEVAYYIYADWMAGAFYNLLSPCRSPLLFTRAVEHMVKDGIMTEGSYQSFLRQRDWIQYNLPGAPATVPGYPAFTEPTLVLVLDLSCPSCRKALEQLSADTRWAGVRRVAVCCGDGPHPAVPGWDYLFPEDANTVFDPHLTPIYFVVAADGTVESGYTPAL